ncbi:MAG: LacI family DNA-binding transcriptional regulator [Anaerolineales bacterium]|nr:LacI family DNA-binding transcriptional regulator [Anaerolineales bacterium]
MTNRITMSDIARQAGVSLMTVSRVINQKDDVSPETRQRILDIIEDLGYRPSGIARSLATQRTGTIGLVVPDIANPYFSGIAQGVAEIAYAEDFSVLLCDCDERPERELEMLQVLDDKRVDGVIVAAPRLDTQLLVPAMANHANVVLINRRFDDPLQSSVIGYVVSDDETGGKLATKTLLDHGYSRVGFLAGPRASYGSMRRMVGYEQALGEAGKPLLPELIQYCSPTVKGGREASHLLLESNPDLRCLFCFNDLVAIGVLQTCSELGLRVPDDLAIVGYDDIPMASWVQPQLTTCRVDFEKMGRQATQLLINYLENCSEGCQNIILQPEIILRASAPGPGPL